MMDSMCNIVFNRRSF